MFTVFLCAYFEKEGMFEKIIKHWCCVYILTRWVQLFKVKNIE
jgi:hypothetical protein